MIHYILYNVECKGTFNLVPKWFGDWLENTVRSTCKHVERERAKAPLKVKWHSCSSKYCHTLFIPCSWAIFRYYLCVRGKANSDAMTHFYSTLAGNHSLTQTLRVLLVLLVSSRFGFEDMHRNCKLLPHSAHRLSLKHRLDCFAICRCTSTTMATAAELASIHAALGKYIAIHTKCRCKCHRKLWIMTCVWSVCVVALAKYENLLHCHC